MGSDAQDPVAAFSAAERERLSAVADQLIPQAHGMPSAGQVIDEKRLRFVLGARPDLVAPLRAALSAELPHDPGARLTALEQAQPDVHAALLLAVVGAYYTDKRVRDLLGYPGQRAITLQSWKYPQYLEEGLLDGVLARGPIWRDPATGQRAVADRPAAISTGHRQV